MNAENRVDYPYRDPDFGFWIYDRLPDYMVAAKPDELWPGRYIMYRSQLPPLAGLWIAEKLTGTSVSIARAKALAGEIFIKKF